MDIKKVGTQIAFLRKAQGLTQGELGERIGVSFQAVSKWERGETLPDTGILPDLAFVLRTTADNILSGGERALNFKGKIKAESIVQGLLCLKKAGELMGKDNLIYRCAIDGINNSMNTDIEEAFADERIFECFVAEGLISALKNGAYVDLTDIKNSFKSEHFRDIVCKYACERGII